MKRTRGFVVMSVAAALVSQSAIRGDELKRAAFFGARLAPVSAEDRVRTKVENGGAVVQTVFPGSTADAAGLRTGDVLTAVAGKSIADPAGFIAAMAGRKAGDSLRIAWSHDGESNDREIALKGRPRETSDAYEVIYGTLPTQVGRLRTILTRPRSAGKRPALFFIQGIGGYSIETAIAGPMGYKEILDTFTRRGYVTFRVEKPGQGDSEGGPTLNVDFDTELDGYRQGLKALRALDFVDTDNVLIFGHSMGGVWGPLLGAEGGVKGIAVYGTVAKTWLEYMLENTRRQEVLAAADPALIDLHLRQDAEIQTLLLSEGQTADDVVAKHPELRERLYASWTDGQSLGGRNLAFFRQLASKNLPEAWGRFNGYALAIWGEADFVSGQGDHELIALLVNRAHPGQGRFLKLPASGHGFARAQSEPEAFAQATKGGAEFNPAIIEALLGWADEVTGKPGRATARSD
jgi:pimeloyl-ACP methyl ester carboxylesterase